MTFKNNDLKLPVFWQDVNQEMTEIAKNDLRNNLPFHYLFKGGVGSGKTSFACLIMMAVRLYSNGLGVKRHKIDASELYSKYSAIVIGNATDKAQAIYECEHALNTPVVIFDDLGKENNTDASRQFMSRVLENYYKGIESGQVLASIITTNLNRSDLRDRYGDRVVSRLYDCNYSHVHNFTNKDFRLLKPRVTGKEVKNG